VKKVIAVFVIAGAVSIWGSWASRVESAVQQPIEFPHKTHVDMGLPCTSCHSRAETDAVAGRPPTALCLSCHGSGETKSAEIKKLKDFGEKGQEVPWRRVWRFPSHVYFPHRPHVTGAKIACQECHGPMETLTRPPTRALKRLSMNDCIACHAKRASTKSNEEQGAHRVKTGAQDIVKDCLACHR
jgi:hypothetical protein